MPVDEVTIGDYVLAGGEAAVLVIVEAVARLLPGVLGNADSLAEESLRRTGCSSLRSTPSPPSWRGLEVPSVLLSGDHGAIARWRAEQSRGALRSAGPTCSLTAGRAPPPAYGRAGPD